MPCFRLTITALLALMLLGCRSHSNEACTDCAIDAGAVDADDDGAPRDGGAEAGEPLEASAADVPELEAAAEEHDGALEADAAEGGEPAYVECTSAADCVLPEALLTCERCQDGSSACPEVRCLERLCATVETRVCPEKPAPAACTSDAECERGTCTLHCQGDARSACMRPVCIQGACMPSYSTCGLQIEACPEGTKPGRECAECGARGECVLSVLGCFERCDATASCPGGQDCVDGLCQLLPSCSSGDGGASSAP